MIDKQYEKLARRLLEDPPTAWPEDIEKFRVPVQPMPASLRSRLKELPHESEVSRLSENDHRREKNLQPFRGIRLQLAVAASFLVVFGTGLYFSIGPLRQYYQNGMKGSQASIVFVQGYVIHENSPMAVGDSLREGESMDVGEGSLAVLVSKGKETEARLRIHPQSQIRIDALKPELFQIRQSRGTLLANLSHKDSNTISRALSIVSSTSESSVVGTLFSTEVNKWGDTTLTTYEGTVVFRRRWDALEDLPEKLIMQNEVLSEVRNIFQTASARVSPGKKSRIVMGDFRSKLKRITPLMQALSDPTMARLRRDQDPSPSEIDAALNSLDKTFATPKERRAMIELVQSIFGNPPEVESVSVNELQTRRSQLEDKTEKEREAVYQELLNANHSMEKMDRETFRREMTRVLGKSPQEIILKNGERIYGTIYGVDGRYRIYTATGTRVMDPEEIEEILFE